MVYAESRFRDLGPSELLLPLRSQAKLSKQLHLPTDVLRLVDGDNRAAPLFRGLELVDVGLRTIVSGIPTKRDDDLVGDNFLFSNFCLGPSACFWNER